jgi:short subunit dehydrogenase-like uncharacterized protein
MTDSVDFIERDRRPYGEREGFLVKSGLAFLASWVLLTPIAFIGAVIEAPRKLLAPKNKTIGGKKLSYPPVGPPLVEVKPLAEREFDLCMYGATGFTGRLACKYLAKQYGTKIKWAIAGRRKDALEKLKTELVAVDPELKDLVLIQVDSNNDEQLQAMCARSRVVITTVGPFVNYGTPLVRACIATKSNVCDITGEISWVEGLVDNYDAEARKQGSKVLSFCGHDCIPWDLSTYILAKKLKEKGEQLVEIDFTDALKGRPSGGTLETVLESPAGGYKTKNSTFRAWRRSDDGSESPYRLTNASHFRPYVSKTNQWTGFFVMSMVNGKVVERSNVLNGYGRKVVYKEHQAADSLSSVVGRLLGLAAVGPVLALPSVLRSQLLPAPGEGLSEEEMEKGFLQVSGVAVGSKGSKVGSRMYFRYDAGYRETARMLVETGLSIALAPERCIRSAGVLTPGACCPEVLLDRLLATGTELSFMPNL